MGRFAAKAARSKFASTVIAAYKNYLDHPEVARQDDPVKNRTKSEKMYLTPFGITVPAKVLVIASASGEAINAYGNKVNTGGARYKQALANDEFAVLPRHYHAARVQIRTGVADTGTPKKSKTSGLPYKSYGGSSKSIPFGQKAGSGEDEKNAFNIIKQAINPNANPVRGTLVTLIPERFSSI
jgi:hypothetical protein